MSDRERKKKDGQRKDKKNERMRDAVKRRQRDAQPPRRATDQPDVQHWKPGSATDRTQQATRSGEPPGRETAGTRARAR